MPESISPIVADSVTLLDRDIDGRTWRLGVDCEKGEIGLWVFSSEMDHPSTILIEPILPDLIEWLENARGKVR